MSKKRSGSMDPVEEKVVRMRKGMAAPDDLELGRVGQNHPVTRAKLEEIEARALAASGRLDELRAEVGLTTSKPDGVTKQKIISRLAKKSDKPAIAAKAKTKLGVKSAAAKVKASAKAVATAKAAVKPAKSKKR